MQKIESVDIILSLPAGPRLHGNPRGGRAKTFAKRARSRQTGFRDDLDAQRKGGMYMATDFRPISDADWPELLAALKGGFATGLNVYRTMAHHPDLLAAWAPLRAHVVTAPALTPDQSEVVILRTGHRLGAAYEWAHHVHRGRKIGMSDPRIASIAGPTAAMSSEDATLARAVDELFDDRRLSPATQSALLDLIGAKGMFDLIATVGFYSVLGFIVESFATPIDAAVAAELKETPLA